LSNYPTEQNLKEPILKQITSGLDLFCRQTGLPVAVFGKNGDNYGQKI
jgi:hypothetical protein